MSLAILCVFTPSDIEFLLWMWYDIDGVERTVLLFSIESGLTFPFGEEVPVDSGGFFVLAMII